MSFSTDQIIFLINPNSGGEKQKKIIADLKNTDDVIHFYISKSKDDLASFFSTLNKQFKVVVVCGGDGTVNSVLKYAINTDLIFAVLGTGSGNGFAREMGYSTKINKLLATIKKGKTRKIDVLKLNDDYCCNMAGVGFDGFIAEQFDKSGKRGLISYVTETLKGFLKFQHFSAAIIADDNRMEGNYFMLNIANTKQFGNNIIIAPNAQPNDGLIDLVVIKQFSKLITPIIILKLLSKKGGNSKYIQYIRAKKVAIKTNYKFYHVDGEPLTNPNNLLLTANFVATINVIQA